MNLQESIKKELKEEIKNKKLPNLFTRRIDLHKYEKMLKKGVPFVYYDSNSLDEFKYKLVKSTLENYMFLKYNIEIDSYSSDTETFVNYLIDVFDPLLKIYYRNIKK